MHRTNADDPDMAGDDASGTGTGEVAPGDRLTVHGHVMGEHDRVGQVIEVRDHGGVRSYLVRWDDDGHEAILYPGTDVTVHHYRHELDRPSTG